MKFYRHNDRRGSGKVVACKDTVSNGPPKSLHWIKLKVTEFIGNNSGNERSVPTPPIKEFIFFVKSNGFMIRFKEFMGTRCFTYKYSS